MQTFYMISEVNLFHFENFKVYAENKTEAREKLKAWLSKNMDYYPAAPNNIDFQSHPSLYSKESRAGWRYLVK